MNPLTQYLPSPRIGRNKNVPHGNITPHRPASYSKWPSPRSVHLGWYPGLCERALLRAHKPGHYGPFVPQWLAELSIPMSPGPATPSLPPSLVILDKVRLVGTAKNEKIWFPCPWSLGWWVGGCGRGQTHRTISSSITRQVSCLTCYLLWAPALLCYQTDHVNILRCRTKMSLSSLSPCVCSEEEPVIVSSWRK